MERYCATGQSLQRAVVPMEDEKEEEEEDEEKEEEVCCLKIDELEFLNLFSANKVATLCSVLLYYVC